MYIARFSYTIKPVDRDQAMRLLEQEVAAAREQGLNAWLLIPLTRAPGAGSLVVDIVLPELARLETFREQGMGGDKGTRDWARDLSQYLLEPPTVELLRVADGGSLEQVING